MQHKGTIPIETPRLLLRRFTPQDAPLAYRNWTSDDAVTKYLRWPTHQSEQITKEVVESWMYLSAGCLSLSTFTSSVGSKSSTIPLMYAPVIAACSMIKIPTMFRIRISVSTAAVIRITFATKMLACSSLLTMIEFSPDFVEVIVA